MRTILDLVLAVPTRELFLRLAGSAGVTQAELDGGMSAIELQRRVASARNEACERPTERVLPAANAFDPPGFSDTIDSWPIVTEVTR